MTKMLYGFDKSGGFIVLDTERRLWLYSYPTSPNAEIAAEMSGIYALAKGEK
jgi:hypothetical protein